MKSLRLILVLVFLPVLALTSGCGNDCDTFCARQGRYIDRCLPQFDSVWGDLNAEWTNRGDFVSSCQQMVDDHTKNNEELAALAKSKGVDVPTEPSLMQKGKMKLLEHSDGQDFDRRYVESMGVKAHEDTIKLFRKGAADAKDPDVKAFAEKTLPKLEHHLQMAQELHTSMGGKSSGKSKK